MKVFKNILIVFIFLFVMPVVVQAGSIRFNTPEKVSNTSYKFTLTIQDMELNHISGNISISNGTISNIVLSNGWMSKTGNNNRFYFYHNGVQSGDYTIATIYVTMTGDSQYSPNNINYGVNKCTKDIYGIYFDDKGNVVNESSYLSVCGKSKDATLKSLSLSSGTLSPNFSSSLEIYSATVDNSVSALSISAIPTHSKAKVISGTHCALKVGLNTCKVVVQAESGDTKTYSISVIRKGNSNDGWHMSSDASVRDLKVHNGTLTTSFSSSKTEYDVSVSKNTSQIYFTFTMNSNGQFMRSDACNITPDTSKCKLTITAEDGVSTKTYSFRILHEGKDNGDTSIDNSNSGEGAVKPIPPSSNQGSFNASNSSSNSNSTNSSSEIPQPDNNEEDNSVNNEVSDIQEEEEHYYSENPKEEESIWVPVIDKEISAAIFYPILTIIILLSGIGLGFVLACIFKKIIKKH